MKNLELIAEELFNKIRGRFPSITIGDEEGKVTDQPKTARFFDFQYKQGNKSLGSVSVTLTDEAVQVMYNTDFVAKEDTLTRNEWYNFLKELRMFAKKRLLNFDTRNINKSNLDKRDYQFLAKQRSGDEQMNEAKLYGTSRKSYQDIGTARVTIEHTKPVNQALAAGRTQYIGSLFIESSEGERFKYPFKHLNGARAMARHVSEGGKPHDDFGKYITSLSEELASLRKFKTYMSRSAVMAEGLSVYNEAVIERIDTIKNTVEKLQRTVNYKEAVDTYESAILEDVPTDVAENWIDQLTIRQFNEELQDVFPYIYKLISEKTKAEELGPDDLAEERTDEAVPMILGLLGLAGAGYVASKVMPTAKDSPLGRAIKIACNEGDSDACKYYKNLDAYVDANDTETLEMLVFQYVKEQFGDFDKVPMEDVHDEEIEGAFDELMGQFSERNTEIEEGYMKGYQKYFCKDCGDQMHTSTTSCPHDCHDESGSWWRDKDGNGVPDIVEGKKKNCGCGQDPCITYGKQEEGMDQFNKYQDHKDLIDDLESGLKDARRGNDMADFIADELGDYIRAGIEDMGEEKWQDSLAGRALAELDNAHLEGPQAQAKAFQDALNVLKQNEGVKTPGDSHYNKEKALELLKKKGITNPSYGELMSAIKQIEKESAEDEQTPITEFILSHYDRHTGQFPKGETAVLTAIEKDYGEKFIEPAKSFIEAINAKFEEINGYKDPDLTEKDRYGKKRMRPTITGNPKMDLIVKKLLADGESLGSIRKKVNLSSIQLQKLRDYMAMQRRQPQQNEEETTFIYKKNFKKGRNNPRIDKNKKRYPNQTQQTETVMASTELDDIRRMAGI